MDYSPRYLRLRATLRKVREEASLTQSELAAKLKKPQTFVSKSELGERRIDFLEVVDFCRACGVEPNKFLSRLEAISDKAKKRRKRKSPRKMGHDGKVS